ncbi:MAG: LCP family protein [Actinomycetota bacterium]
MQRGVIALNVVLIAATMASALLLDYAYGRAASINRVALDRSLTDIPAGQEPGERVMNILLVGSDSSAGLDEDDPIQIGRQGERFGDVIIIAHIDERTGGMALLSLPRDLWVEIADTGREARINRAFVDGGPAALIETIENQFDLPIHHYVNVDFAGFRGLVAAIDSVDVYFETPARDWNVNAQPEPRSQTGFLMPVAGCHSLDPETALAYVRSRYYQTQDADGEWVTDPTSDLGRIRRQQDFLRRVLKRAIDMGARNPFVLRDLIDTGLENVAIDERLTPQLLLDLGMAYRSFDPAQLQTYSLPAVDGRVGRNQVLLPQLDEAEPVLELFRGAPFDDPSTVDLSVRAVDGEGEAELQALRSRGYRPEVVELASADATPGLVLQHGPDGRHAALQVAEVIGAEVTIEQVAGLLGRSVVVRIGPTPLAGPDLAAPSIGEGATGGGAVEGATDRGAVEGATDRGAVEGATGGGAVEGAGGGGDAALIDELAACG